MDASNEDDENITEIRQSDEEISSENITAFKNISNSHSCEQEQEPNNEYLEETNGNQEKTCKEVKNIDDHITDELNITSQELCDLPEVRHLENDSESDILQVETSDSDHSSTDSVCNLSLNDENKITENSNEELNLESGLSLKETVDKEIKKDNETLKEEITSETDVESNSETKIVISSNKEIETENINVNDSQTNEKECLGETNAQINCISRSHEIEDENNILSELEAELERNEKINMSSKHNMKHLLSKDQKVVKDYLKVSNTRLKNINSSSNKQTVDYYELQIEFLEKANSQLQRELSEVKERFSNQDTEISKQLTHVKATLETKIEKLQSQYEAAQKERNNMVMRYAQSERDVITLRKTKEELERKLWDAAKERDGIINRVKSLNTEKGHLCSNLNNKAAEITALHRECDHLKEELNSRDIRIKWTQNKLKTEMDAHKETQTKLEHTLLRLQEKREEAEQVRKDCQEMIRRYQEAEEIKSVSLDSQLRQKLSELEVQKQERSDQEEVYQLVKLELEALKKKHKLIIEENNVLTLKIHTLEKERLDHEQTVSKLKECQNTLRQEVVDLTGRLAEMENLQMQLEREKERVVAAQKEVERFRQVNSELQTDMEACRNKEGELLEFTERLTAKNVTLQSEHGLLEGKASTLEDEINSSNKKCAELEAKNLELVSCLDEEKNQRMEETQLLARKLAEKTKMVEQLTIKLEDTRNENRVMKRRHITSIKELSRELLHAKKKLESYDTNHYGSDSVSLGSRTSSTGSLDTITNNQSSSHPVNQNSSPLVPPAVVFSGGKNSNLHSSGQSKTSDSKMSPTESQQQNQSMLPPPYASLLSEVDKQVLIEKIVKLQKSMVRKNEKIEFQEEHISHLLDEIKKKARIIQSYIIREETGALVSNSMDQNKADVARRGGVMASVYTSQVSDSHMTLELSLEINNKLQAILEDTLLKNITLKENINTLGEEIARITKEHRLLNHQLTKYKNGK